MTKREELGVVCEENWSQEYRMALSGKEEGMNQRRLRILICDIDPDILIHLEKMLEDAGFDTTSTWNVVDLERLLQQHSFQLLIRRAPLTDGCRTAREEISRHAGAGSKRALLGMARTR